MQIGTKTSTTTILIWRLAGTGRPPGESHNVNEVWCESVWRWMGLRQAVVVNLVRS